MSDIEKASQDAVEAARQGDQFAMLLAAMQAAQQDRPAPCAHATAPARSEAAKWVAIGTGGAFLAVALAVSMLAVAIGAVAVTVCLLVLRSMWHEHQAKGR